MSEKIIPLKTADDAVVWFENAANEAKESATSIALANARNGSVKGMLAVKKLYLDYERFKTKNSSLFEMQKFFAAK